MQPAVQSADPPVQEATASAASQAQPVPDAPAAVSAPVAPQSEAAAETPSCGTAWEALGLSSEDRCVSLSVVSSCKNASCRTLCRARLEQAGLAAETAKLAIDRLGFRSSSDLPVMMITLQLHHFDVMELILPLSPLYPSSPRKQSISEAALVDLTVSGVLPPQQLVRLIKLVGSTGANPRLRG